MIKICIWGAKKCTHKLQKHANKSQNICFVTNDPSLQWRKFAYLEDQTFCPMPLPIQQPIGASLASWCRQYSDDSRPLHVCYVIKSAGTGHCDQCHEGSVCGKPLHHSSPVVDTRMHIAAASYEVKRWNVLWLCIYIPYILYDFGLFLFKSDCFIVVALKAILNTADNGYQWYWPRLCIISLQQEANYLFHYLPFLFCNTFLPSRKAVLVYFGLSVRALVEVKHTPRI